jgi:hypothetical protein
MADLARISPGEVGEAALLAGQTGSDDLLVREALWYLADHDHDRSNSASALDKWQQATAAANATDPPSRP